MTLKSFIKEIFVIEHTPYKRVRAVSFQESLAELLRLESRSLTSTCTRVENWTGSSTMMEITGTLECSIVGSDGEVFFSKNLEYDAKVFDSLESFTAVRNQQLQKLSLCFLRKVHRIIEDTRNGQTTIGYSLKDVSHWINEFMTNFPTPPTTPAQQTSVEQVAAKSPKVEINTYDDRFWQEGVAGDCNIITYNGEDVRGVATVIDPVLRKHLIDSHNRIVREMIDAQRTGQETCGG